MLHSSRVYKSLIFKQLCYVCSLCTEWYEVIVHTYRIIQLHSVAYNHIQNHTVSFNTDVCHKHISYVVFWLVACKSGWQSCLIHKGLTTQHNRRSDNIPGQQIRTKGVPPSQIRTRGGVGVKTRIGDGAKVHKVGQGSPPSQNSDQGGGGFLA